MKYSQNSGAMPRKSNAFPIEIHAEWLAAVRERVESLGVAAVAKEAGVTRQTLWRLLSDADQRPTVEAAERVRRAIAELDPDGAPIPPPFVQVRGPRHATWRMALGARSTNKR